MDGKVGGIAVIIGARISALAGPSQRDVTGVPPLAVYRLSD
jgi:hypothetical protein